MSKHSTKNQEPTTSRPERDPLSALGHEVLSLFRGPLADVRFPELDRASLDAAADDALAAQVEVEATERALEDARNRAREASASFGRSVARALAYARVFAQGQPELEGLLSGSAVLAAASGQAGSRDATDGRTAEREKKRRGRPRKDTSSAELLPMGAEAGREAVEEEAEAEPAIAAA